MRICTTRAKPPPLPYLGGPPPPPRPVRLAAVGREAEFCGPVALAALTGLPPNSWPDGPMPWPDMGAALKAAGFRPRTFTGEARDLRLKDFGRQRPGEDSTDDPFIGLWLLGLDYSAGGAPHAVALSLVPLLPGSERYDRRFVDNRFREPVPLEAVAATEDYRRFRIVKAWRIDRREAP